MTKLVPASEPNYKTYEESLCEHHTITSHHTIMIFNLLPMPTLQQCNFWCGSSFRNAECRVM